MSEGIEPLSDSQDRPGPVVPTDAAPDPAASVGNAAVPGRGTADEPLSWDPCPFCHLPWMQGDQAMLIGSVQADGAARLVFAHIDCLRREVTGG